MITLLCTAAHAYTVEPLERTGRLEFRTLSWTQAFRARALPRGTYLFTDLDRLGFWELELAARLYRRLRAGGARVLNDPARVLQRHALLSRLHCDGLNDFRAWRVEEPERPDRFPVFLRTQSAHRGPLSDLLHDAAEVEAAIGRALDEGIPIRELMLVEYRAQPIAPNLFRKLAAMRVGDRIVSTLCVHESRWSAKHGELGIATEALYRDEYDIVERNRWEGLVDPAFERAGVEYGRVDFALVDGRPQFYEINTNPTLSRILEHPNPIRPRADALFFDRLFDALAAIDTPSGGARIELDEPQLERQRRFDRWVVRSRWMP
jgi:hypothetical protein